jgi:hypothetical protein
MKLNIGEIFPRRNIIFFSICAAGILIFIFLVILPYQGALAKSDRKIQDLKLRIDDQRNYSGLYQFLTKSAQQKDGLVLPVPVKAKLVRADVDKVPVLMRAIARKARLNVQSIVPDVKALTPDARHLSVTAVVTGRLSGFRGFLAGLGEMPYLEQIEEIQIRRIPDSKEFRVKMWLALGP